MPGPQRRGTTAGGGDGRRDRRDRDGRGGRDGGDKTAFVERVVAINRVAKVVKGGRRFSFTALVVVGDGDGTVGVGYGKAKEVPAAIAKGVEEAKKHFFKVPRIPGTIPHPIQGEEAAGVVLLRPASPGTGVIAGGPVRAVLECAGIHDVLSKSLGSDNAINVVHATVAALKGLERPEAVAARRGLPIGGRRARRAAAGPGRDGGLMGRAQGDAGRVEDRRQAEPAGHPALAGAEADRRRRGQGGPSGDPWDGQGGAPPRHRRGGGLRWSEGDSSAKTPLKVHHLRPAPGSRTAKTRVGRGEGSKGKTAGRGTKGTKARYQVPAAFEGGQMPLHMRLPKLRGFTNPFRTEYQVVNLDRLDELFPDGGSVDRAGPGGPGRGPRRPAGEGAGDRRDLGGARRHRLRTRARNRRRGGTTSSARRKSWPVGPRQAAPSASPRVCHRPARRTPPAPLTARRSRRSGAQEVCVLTAFARAFRTPDLRRKLLFTLAIMALFRLGSFIPTPGVDYQAVQTCVKQTQTDRAGLYQLVNLFSGGALLQLSIFALGIMPYITASIIIQLLTVVIPRFEALKQEGQTGTAKLTQYTRYLTIGLAILQSTHAGRHRPQRGPAVQRLHRDSWSRTTAW